MSLRRVHLLALCGIAFPVLFGVSGCAEPRDPIDRVQPNYVDKSFFTGEWYYQRTVVDMPGANGFTYIGATDYKGLTRVTWDLQQDFLYARRHTEFIKNADGRDTIERNGGRYQGEVVAAFKIQKHFDIARPYNDTTGEELNVLVENDVDRPWYERRYMRVDWSQNLVHNYDLDFEAASIEPVPYYVQEFDPVTGKRNPDAPHFEPEQAYFDVTTKLFAKGGSIDYPGYGKVPLCWLDETVECGAAEYTIRHSFKKLESQVRYEPLPYKGKATDVFGFFWTDRLVYDPQAGLLEQGRERYLNRFNLWKTAYAADGTLLPAVDREPEPIVYHVNPDWPQDDAVLANAARSVADKWNAVLVDVVRATGNTRLGDRRMFVLCDHNPVREGDPAECGAPGTAPRIGDLRYSFLAYVPKYMTNGLLGLGPSNVDPETGEIVSGTAYVYHHNNLAAFETQQMVELLNGTMTADAYIRGLDLTDWIKETRSGLTGSRTYGLEDAAPLIARLASGPATRLWDSTRRAPTAADEAAQRTSGLREWLRPYLSDLYARRTSLRADADTSSGALAQLRGTPVEAMLLNDEIFAGVGINPRLPVSEQMKDQASVARGGFSRFAADRQRIRQQFAARRNMDLPEMADDALLGLAEELAAQNLSSSEVYDRLRAAIYRAVLAHELGHTLGLRHNFAGSEDALNYADEYWTLRAADGTVEPRLVDPVTPNEIKGRIYSHAYSSVMDYASRYGLDEGGPGKYDRAALLFGYAGKVEVFKDSAGVPVEDFRAWYEDDGAVLRFGQTAPYAPHYTTYYNRMKEKLYGGHNRELVDVANLADDFSKDRHGRPRVPYLFCSDSRVDLSDHCLTRDAGADSAERMKNLIDEIDTWYITRNFPRGRIGNSQANYVARYYNRIYGRLKHWNDEFALYKEILPRFYDSAQLTAFYADPVLGWGARTWSVQSAFNKLVQTILAPDVGSYDVRSGPDGKALLTKVEGADAPVNLGVTSARYFSTSWESDRECGYAWWECLDHVGFYLDKIMAIEALSDTRTNFVARTTPEDLREWRIGYFSTFPEAISKINAAMMSHGNPGIFFGTTAASPGWERVGPYVKDGKLEFPNYAGELKEANAGTIDPSTTFSVQLYWQVLGMSRFPATFESSFADESKIYIMGSVGAPVASNTQVATYLDPFTRLTYGALRRQRNMPFDPAVHWKGAGEAVIDRANALLARSNYCDASGYMTPSNTDDDCVVPAEGHTQDEVTAMLMDYNELIKTLVLVNRTMNWGSPYSPQAQ